MSNSGNLNAKACNHYIAKTPCKSSILKNWASIVGLALLNLVTFFGFAGAIEPSQHEPSGVVKTLQDSLVAVMKNAENLGYQGRFEKLAPIVVQTHDIPYVVRLTVGKHWKSFDEGQRETLVGTFRHLSIATYADRFNGYSGERFNLVSERPLKRGKMLVETTFTQSDGKQLQFNYVLHQKNEQWGIINISVDGVSDLALKRAEYTSLVESGGFSALILKMKDQIQRYENGSE